MKTPTYHIPYTKYFLLIALFIVAFLERTVFDLGANIELITMAMILASFHLGRKETFWLILAIMATTDRVIGNTSILLFTWSGFLIPALLISTGYSKIKDYLELELRLKLKNKITPKLLTLTGLGLTSNVFFYLWTNFGVWWLDSWNMYPKTLSGLMMSYINGLPFLRNQFISSIVFIPSGMIAIEVFKLLYKKYATSSAKPYQKRAIS